mmetsp:Transcript_24309/g.57749  ORF Transcript_24309/g.57749 Transcript_24309/m.57749 type:complete len:93 (-) Transcript_24309:749-1027(-)
MMVKAEFLSLYRGEDKGGPAPDVVVGGGQGGADRQVSDWDDPPPRIQAAHETPGHDEAALFAATATRPASNDRGRSRLGAGEQKCGVPGERL